MMLNFNSSGNNQVDSIHQVLSVYKEDTVKVKAILDLSKSFLSTDPSQGILVAKQAIDLSKKLNYKKGIALAYKNIGIAFYNQGKFIEETIPVKSIYIREAEESEAQGKPFEGIKHDDIRTLMKNIFDSLVKQGKELAFSF